MKCNASSNPGRRAFLKLSGLAALGSGFAPLAARTTDSTRALHIREAQVELSAGRTFSSLTYDSQLPGPLLRAVVGRPLRIAVYNHTNEPDAIHWQGHASRVFAPMSSQVVQFNPRRAGIYLYHSEQVAAVRLDRGLYSSQIGALLVEPARGASLRQQVLILKDCEPRVRRTRRGCEIGYSALTINGRIPETNFHLDAPVGALLAVHVINASATESLSLALPGNEFDVVGLDGCPTAEPVRLRELHLHPGERVSARVRYERPSGWMAHSCMTDGMDYERFAPQFGAQRPADTVDVVLARHDAARSGFNRWSINGISFSTSGTEPLLRVRYGNRYRLRILNTSDEILPLHLQRHQLQVVRMGSRATAIRKDVVAVGAHQRMEVDFVADDRGPALLHCTRQLHRDFGLMGVIDYT